MRGTDRRRGTGNNRPVPAESRIQSVRGQKWANWPNDRSMDQSITFPKVISAVSCPGKPPPMSSKCIRWPMEAPSSKSFLEAAIARRNAEGSRHPLPTWNLMGMRGERNGEGSDRKGEDHGRDADQVHAHLQHRAQELIGNFGVAPEFGGQRALGSGVGYGEAQNESEMVVGKGIFGTSHWGQECICRILANSSTLSKVISRRPSHKWTHQILNMADLPVLSACWMYERVLHGFA